MKKHSKTKAHKKASHHTKKSTSFLGIKMPDEKNFFVIFATILVFTIILAISTLTIPDDVQHSAADTANDAAKPAPVFSALPTLSSSGPENGHVPASSKTTVLSFDVRANGGDVNFKNSGDNSQAYQSMKDFQPSNSNHIAVALSSNVPVASGADCTLINNDGLVLATTKTLKGYEQVLRFTFEKNELSVKVGSNVSLSVLCNTEAMLSNVASYAQPTVTAKLLSDKGSVEWNDGVHPDVTGYGDKAVPKDMMGYTVMGQAQY